MSDRVSAESARSYFLPFILGNGGRSHGLSQRIFNKYGIVSLICDSRRHALDFLDFSSRSIRLCPTDSPRLLCEQLMALAEQSPYMLPLIIPITDEYARMTNAVRDVLETRFIISSPDELFTLSPLASIKR
ncbi:MAG: hypothetical protein J6M03_07410 [Clostridia bacterium]|nr:hypothetical protein [Clostridia bacterium]